MQRFDPATRRPGEERLRAPLFTGQSGEHQDEATRAQGELPYDA